MNGDPASGDEPKDDPSERDPADGARSGDVTVRDGGARVAEVELHRPPANFFDIELLRGVVDGIDWAERRGFRAVVLGSEGRHFCAGFDFSSSAAPADDTLRALYEQGLALVDSPLPIVAAVQGAAVGGGLGLALACDLRVASPNSRFSANFGRLGLHHGFGLSFTLPAVIGPQRALDLLLTARTVGGEEAARLGLCDRLAEDPRAGAFELASTIASAAPLAVRAMRQTQRAGIAEAFASAVARERGEQLRLMTTLDFEEGVAASLERRDARFEGR